MLIKTKKENIVKALKLVNKKYKWNITFNRFDSLSENRHQVTLKVIDSYKPGHRFGFNHNYGSLNPTVNTNRRHLPCACWHVHGHFFESLFSIDRETVIIAKGKKITKEGGNWEDTNIGSIMAPMYFSEAYECES